MVLTNYIITISNDNYNIISIKAYSIMLINNKYLRTRYLSILILIMPVQIRINATQLLIVVN